MTGDDAAYLIYGVLLVIFIGSGLVARRTPLGSTLKMALAWVAIFAVGYVGLSFRHDVADLFGSRLLGRAIVQGGTMRRPMADDGHFWVDASINGHPARLMVDSGATVTTISEATAARTGVATSEGDRTIVGTANGPMTVRRSRLATFRVGKIEVADLGVHVAAGDDLDVVGMNFLSKLARWSVEGRWLILQPAPRTS